MIRPPIAGRWGALIAAGCCAGAFMCGCGNSPPDSRVTQIQKLEDELATDKRLRAQNEQQLSEQARVIQKLQGVDAGKRMQQLVHVDHIEIERLSGGYDDNKDGSDDGVVVYLRLIDDEGDVIKAAGSASLRLLDLTRPDVSQTVGAGQWSAEEMRPLWYGKLMTNHYTLRVPWAGGAKVAPAKSVTVMAQYTDLLTGQMFATQKEVEIKTLTPSSRPS